MELCDGVRNSVKCIHNVVNIFIICMNIVMEQTIVKWCGIHFCTVIWWVL